MQKHGTSALPVRFQHVIYDLATLVPMLQQCCVSAALEVPLDDLEDAKEFQATFHLRLRRCRT